MRERVADMKNGQLCQKNLSSWQNLRIKDSTIGALATWFYRIRTRVTYMVTLVLKRQKKKTDCCAERTWVVEQIFKSTWSASFVSPRISLTLPSFALLQFWSQVSLKQAWLCLQQWNGRLQCTARDKWIRTSPISCQFHQTGQETAVLSRARDSTG